MMVPVVDWPEPSDPLAFPGLYTTGLPGRPFLSDGHTLVVGGMPP